MQEVIRMSVPIRFLLVACTQAPLTIAPNPQSPAPSPQPLARWLHLVPRAERLDVCDQLPDVVVVQLHAPRGHAEAASLGDASEHLRIVHSVDPVDIAQAWTHAAAAVIAVAAGAVHPGEQLAPLPHRNLVVPIRVRL